MVSRINDENYYQIQGFMINRLGLKGVPLNVYAIIYGFSQDGESEYTGSLQYLCDFCGGVSKPTVINALKTLTETGYIIRREEYINSILLPRYRANLPLLKKLNGGSKEILTGVVKNFNGGSKETLPNNKDNNKSLNNKDNNNHESDFATLWEMYPRKIGKSKAYKDYLKAIKNGVTFETVKQGIEAYCKQIEAEAAQKAKAQKITLEAAKAEQIKFVKHGSTWFHGECWNDEYKTSSVPAAKFELKGGVNL